MSLIDHDGLDSLPDPQEKPVSHADNPGRLGDSNGAARHAARSDHDRLPDPPDTETTARVPVFAPHSRDGGEGSDDYPHVVAVLGEKTRVIVCNEGIQWIVQHKKGQQWRGRSFCRTREALLRCSGHPNHPALLALSERCS
jgi:hypothetical protein